MADDLDLTGGIITATESSSIQAPADSVDVSDYDLADVVLVVTEITESTTVHIRILTSMSKTNVGWVEATEFSEVSAAGSEMKASIHFLKYIRWKVTGLTGEKSVTFSIAGMLRELAG